MTDFGIAGYASAKIPAEAASAERILNAKRGETVAEFRNKVNPITGYYDQWDVAGFFLDGSISFETKIEALFGKLVAKVVSGYGMEKITALVGEFASKTEKKEN